MTDIAYAVVVQPLSLEDGGGYAASVPDLPGCMSDGASPEEALVNVADAIRTWIEAAEDVGHPVPPPRSSIDVSALPLVKAA